METIVLVLVLFCATVALVGVWVGGIKRRIETIEDRLAAIETAAKNPHSERCAKSLEAISTGIDRHLMTMVALVDQKNRRAVVQSFDSRTNLTKEESVGPHPKN